MDLSQNYAVELLKELKENYYAKGVKVELESEITNLEENMQLKNMTSTLGLDFTVKIGGCGAIRDIYETKLLSANSIVAPMIESPYALKKYVQTLNSVYDNSEINKKKYYINIETITGIEKLDDILCSDDMSYISGIVFGRSDLSSSFNLEDVNSEKIFEIAMLLAQKAKKINKEFIIGGKVLPNSIDFFKRFPKGLLTSIETRKIIFDAEKLLSLNNPQNGLLKAIEFEMLLLKKKKGLIESDKIRLLELEERYTINI